MCVLLKDAIIRNFQNYMGAIYWFSPIVHSYCRLFLRLSFPSLEVRVAEQALVKCCNAVVLITIPWATEEGRNEEGCYEGRNSSLVWKKCTNWSLKWIKLKCYFLPFQREETRIEIRPCFRCQSNRSRLLWMIVPSFAILLTLFRTIQFFNNKFCILVRRNWSEKHFYMIYVWSILA